MLLKVKTTAVVAVVVVVVVAVVAVVEGRTILFMPKHTPHTTELPNQDLRRPLVLITKVLQNLANGIQFQKDRRVSE